MEPCRRRDSWNIHWALAMPNSIQYSIEYNLELVHLRFLFKENGCVSSSSVPLPPRCFWSIGTSWKARCVNKNLHYWAYLLRLFFCTMSTKPKKCDEPSPIGNRSQESLFFCFGPRFPNRVLDVPTNLEDLHLGHLRLYWSSLDQKKCL